MPSPAAWRLCAVINLLVYFKTWTLDMNKHLKCAHDSLQPGASVLPISMMHERVGGENTIIPGVCINCVSHLCTDTCSAAQGGEGENGVQEVLTSCSALDKDHTSDAAVYIIPMCFCSIKRNDLTFSAPCCNTHRSPTAGAVLNVGRNIASSGRAAAGAPVTAPWLISEACGKSAARYTCSHLRASSGGRLPAH